MKKMYMTPLAENFEVENTSLLAGTEAGENDPEKENPNPEDPEGGCSKRGFRGSDLEFDDDDDF